MRGTCQWAGRARASGQAAWIHACDCTTGATTHPPRWLPCPNGRRSHRGPLMLERPTDPSPSHPVRSTSMSAGARHRSSAGARSERAEHQAQVRVRCEQPARGSLRDPGRASQTRNGPTRLHGRTALGQPPEALLASKSGESSASAAPFWAWPSVAAVSSRHGLAPRSRIVAQVQLHPMTDVRSGRYCYSPASVAAHPRWGAPSWRRGELAWRRCVQPSCTVRYAVILDYHDSTWWTKFSFPE